MSQKTELIDFWKEKLFFTKIELKAFKDIKREDFLPDNLKYRAYEDMPLPLIRGKTISQPTTVMLMTHALELQVGDKVFEVGAGSGYQSAIISKIIGDKGKVITTEVVPELVSLAKQNILKAKINNIEIFEDDGSKGIPEEAPFDKIIITCACKEFPKPLLDQLKLEGIILGPVGNKNEQEMVRGFKDKNGKLELEFLGQFLFSPMYGKFGFED